ncbi:hypothetical protein U1Q18_017276 [Sarracenia purpurea var. burkii]
MDFPRVAHVPLLRRQDQIDEAEAREASEDGDGGGSTSVVERSVLENQKENGLFRSRACQTEQRLTEKKMRKSGLKGGERNSNGEPRAICKCKRFRETLCPF